MVEQGGLLQLQKPSANLSQVVLCRTNNGRKPRYGNSVQAPTPLRLGKRKQLSLT